MEKIFIFGRGEYLKNKYRTFRENYQIEGFLDNAVERDMEDELYHLPVYNPSKVSVLPAYPVYCVASDFFGMWRQLKELGVEDDRIRFGASISPQQSGLEKIAFSKGESLKSKGQKLVYIDEGIEYGLDSMNELKSIIRNKVKQNSADVSTVGKLSNIPVSRIFGSDRGKAVDRYYIEKFLDLYSDDIKGTVMEIANNQYTLKYGGDKVDKSVVSHVMGWGRNAIKVNFETGEGVVENSVDCLICTQTLQYIFDLNKAIHNIYKILKPGGTALITVPGIKPLCEYDDNQWGEYWSFTSRSIDRLCSQVCDRDSYRVAQYGNVKAAAAYLYGVCVEDICTQDLEYHDQQFPFLIAARIRKKDNNDAEN